MPGKPPEGTKGIGWMGPAPSVVPAQAMSLIGAILIIAMILVGSGVLFR